MIAFDGEGGVKGRMKGAISAGGVPRLAEPGGEITSALAFFFFFTRVQILLSAAPQTLNVVVMAQEDQAGEHRHRKGVLRFEPPDVERGDQRADDSAQGRVTAEQDGQQPVPAITPVRSSPMGAIAPKAVATPLPPRK